MIRFTHFWPAFSTKALTAFIPAAFILAAVLPVSVQAESGYTIATVDIVKILNSTPESKRAKSALEKASKAAKSEIEDRREDLKSKEERLREEKVSASSPEAEAFQKEAKEFARYVKDTEEELRRKYLKTNQEVSQKVLEVVREYAEENDIDLVLDRSEKPRSPILFGTAQLDITDKVIEELNG